MKITEKDIFNFVYYPGKLSEEKYGYIESNRNLFDKQIKLCENTLSGLNTNAKNKVVLKKKAHLKVQKQRQYYLAAESITLDKSIKTETYTNNEGNIIAKAVFYPDKTKIFIFSEAEKPIKNFKLVINPANKSIPITDINDPIELPPGFEIESINIEL